MIDPVITQLAVVDHSTPYRSNGDRLIATFSATFAGMSIKGLRLIRTAAGGFRVVSPAVTRENGKEAIRFTDSQAHHRVMDAARRLYVQMGGRFGDYAGQKAENPE